MPGNRIVLSDVSNSLEDLSNVCASISCRAQKSDDFKVEEVASEKSVHVTRSLNRERFSS